MKKSLLLLSTLTVLSSCVNSKQEFPTLSLPQAWGGVQSEDVSLVEAPALRKWWKNFNDPTLNLLIQQTLSDSPDRNIAKARIVEARGLRRTARSFLFPKIGASGNVNRQDFGFAGPDNFFEAGFDASYEVDVFGRVRNTINAQEARLQALEAEYQDVTLTLIADVTRSYINYRAAQKQMAIANKNLTIQTKTLELIKQQKEFGEAPQLDVERSENLVNTTKASIPEFERLAHNYRLELSVLTGDLPEEILPVLQNVADIPGASIEPVLLTPSDVLSRRPDIRAASANLAANTALSKTAVAELFPSFTIEGFFGYSEGAFSGTESIWRIVLGSAVTLIDFGRIEGAIDVARAREIQSYELMRKTVLQAISDVEISLSDAAHINEQRVSLQKAFDSAERSFVLSETLYREGEISFLDVLDAQRTVNEADSALVSAEAAQVESFVRLYKSLGVY